MASRVCSRPLKLPSLLFFFSFYSIVFTWGSATVILMGKNVTVSFEDIAANFAPVIKSSGISGKLYVAEPLDACSPLTNKFRPKGNSSSRFVLITRNSCSFEEKVRRAQKAGFKAVIVYDNEDSGALVKMAGSSAGIKIPAVFVSKASGEKLSNYAGQDNIDVWLVPSFEDAAWSIMAISFIALLAMSALLATCFFVRRHRIRRQQPRQQVREFHGMSSRLVKAMPSLIFTAVLEDNCTSATCAICLDDYNVGDKIRVLPCKHKFHAICVDCWLTSWRTFCPVCKRDARTSTGIPPASESTPLLFSAPSSIASSPVSSVRSSLRSSSALRIASPSPRSCSSPLNYSAMNSPNRQNRPVYHYHTHHIPSSSMSMNRSSADPTNLSARRSSSHLVSPSPHSSSLGYPSSPLNSRYMSPYVPSPSYMSSMYMGSASTSRPPNPLHYSESAASFSPYASAHSLPDC